MSQNKTSSRLYPLIKSVAAAAALPVLFTYIMIAKPDYKLMNAAAHVVLPAAHAVGDLVTWPVRAVGNLANNIRELSMLRAENEELHARLVQAMQRAETCDIAIAENQKLAREMDMAAATPAGAIIADVMHDNTAFRHSTYLISKGADDGIEPGMIAVAFDGRLAGVVIDSGVNFARVRALTDDATNIAVRVAGSEVYGFLTGAGDGAKIGFFSDPEFQPTPGLKLVTSSISGVMPAGLPVGTMTSESDVDVTRPGRLSGVMILRFNGPDKYK